MTAAVDDHGSKFHNVDRIQFAYCSYCDSLAEEGGGSGIRILTKLKRRSGVGEVRNKWY
jgi:hypothetical protein